MTQMNLWETRSSSLKHLESDLKVEAEVINEAFQILDDCINHFSSAVHSSSFLQVCGLTVVKARHLALGCYSLSLDGLGQEAGALVRPLIETFELLLYFQEDPKRCEQAFDGTLPSAGEIGKQIQGKFQRMRNHLNVSASHFSFNDYSVQHLIDWHGVAFKTSQRGSEPTLRRNLATLFTFLIILSAQATNCLYDAKIITDGSLQKRIDECRTKGLSLFRPILGS